MNDGQLPLDPQWLVHRPLTGPRAGHMGEQVFCEKWLELMQSEVDFREVDEPDHLAKLDRILRNVAVTALSNRECTVAASWACYLGCNIGASVISTGDRLRGVADYERYLLAWARHNKRVYGVNNGIRAIEFFLAPQDHFRDSPFCGITLDRIPDLSVTDYEVVEHLWLWLGTDDGTEWLTECNGEIQRRQAAAWRAHERRNDTPGTQEVTI